MPSELYNSNDYCSLAEEMELLKAENSELAADKLHLIQAAFDNGYSYYYAAHDICCRDMERKIKLLEADYAVSNRELLILQVENERLTAEVKRINALLVDAVEEYDGIWKKKDEELASLQSIIARLKEDVERLYKMDDICCCNEHENFITCVSNDDIHAPNCAKNLHRQLMAEIERGE